MFAARVASRSTLETGNTWVRPLVSTKRNEPKALSGLGLRRNHRAVGENDDIPVPGGVRSS